MSDLPELTCDCCNKNKAVGVASSGYGAVSFAWCEECLSRQVEPEWILAYLYYDVGDHGEGLVAEEMLPGTYKDGRYWTWPEWRAWVQTQPDPPDPYLDYEPPWNHFLYVWYDWLWWRIRKYWAILRGKNPDNLF